MTKCKRPYEVLAKNIKANAGILGALNNGAGKSKEI